MLQSEAAGKPAPRAPDRGSHVHAGGRSIYRGGAISLRPRHHLRARAVARAAAGHPAPELEMHGRFGPVGIGHVHGHVDPIVDLPGGVGALDRYLHRRAPRRAAGRAEPDSPAGPNRVAEFAARGVPRAHHVGRGIAGLFGRDALRLGLPLLRHRGPHLLEYLLGRARHFDGRHFCHQFPLAGLDARRRDLARTLRRERRIARQQDGAGYRYAQHPHCLVLPLVAPP